MKLIDRIADLIFPPRCVLCTGLLEREGKSICPTCDTAAKIFLHHPWKIPHVKSWYALWQYHDAVRESLVRYKFCNRRNYRHTYGKELAEKIMEWKIDFDLITWVPVSRMRKFTRGYDQVQLIAEAVGRELGRKPERVLQKWKNNPKQSTIRGMESRQKNVRGVYRMAKDANVKGKRILLIDDIITTGATISEAASVLKAAGAKEVIAACVAVANRYHS